MVSTKSQEPRGGVEGNLAEKSNVGGRKIHLIAGQRKQGRTSTPN